VAHLIEAVRDVLDANIAKHLAMPVEAMSARSKTNHRRTRRKRSSRSDSRIFEDHRADDVDPELLRGMQIEIGLRLAPRDVLLAAVDVRLEGVAKAEMIEMSANPARRTGRSDRPR